MARTSVTDWNERRDYRAPCWRIRETDGAECGRANVQTTMDRAEVRCPACLEHIADATSVRVGELREALAASFPERERREHERAARIMAAELQRADDAQLAGGAA